MLSEILGDVHHTRDVNKLLLAGLPIHAEIR